MTRRLFIFHESSGWEAGKQSEWRKICIYRRVCYDRTYKFYSCWGGALGYIYIYIYIYPGRVGFNGFSESWPTTWPVKSIFLPFEPKYICYNQKPIFYELGVKVISSILWTFQEVKAFSKLIWKLNIKIDNGC